jgi:hypothetical protein
MLDARFSYESFVSSSDRAALATELSAELTRRLRSSTRPASECYALIDELRQLGHDLWSFDESDDFQIWCADWTKPPRPFELLVELHYAEEQPSSALTIFRPTERETD